MTTTMDKAHSALTTARQKIGEWDHALEAARAERDRSRQAAPADPAALDGFADQYARAEGKVRAAEQGRRTADAGVLAALEGVVRASLDDERAALKAAEQAHAAHRRKLDALLAKVTELDNADYRPVTLDDVVLNPGDGGSVKTSRADVLSGEVNRFDASVRRLAGVLETGEVSAFNRIDYPAHVLEYVDARAAAGVPTKAETERAAAIEVDRLNAARNAEDAGEGRFSAWRSRLGISA